MAESLARHGSPELRDEDLQAVRDAFLRQGSDFPPHGRLIGYYDAEDGRRYSYHFWAYSLSTLPARALLAAAGGDVLRAAQVTNALYMAVALLAVFLWAPLAEPQKLVANALLFLSPALWFILWPHPEVASFAGVVLALVANARGATRSAVLWAALAALQNVQLGLLVAFLWLRGVVRGRLEWREALFIEARLPWRAALGHTLPALLLAAHPLFFYLHFGTPSVVAREAASLSKLSPARALALVFDLNLGLLPYIPLALLLYLGVVAALALGRRRGATLALFLVFAALVLASTLQWNFNHGTSGPSRYVIWLLPFVFLGLASEARSRGLLLAAALAALVQGGIAWSRGGFVPRYDYLEHSPVAAWVLRHVPALYDPDYEVFIKRTLHTEGPTRGPYVYAVAGRCRKVLANRSHERAVRERCGSIPERYLPWFRAETSRPADARAWRYLNY